MSDNMPRLVVYSTADSDLKSPAIGRFFAGGKFLPLIISGSDEADVRAKAEKWWTEERARTGSTGRAPAQVVIGEGGDSQPLPIRSARGGGRGQAVAGKIWIVNKAGHCLRVFPQEAEQYYEQGYQRGRTYSAA